MMYQRLSHGGLYADELSAVLELLQEFDPEAAVMYDRDVEPHVGRYSKHWAFAGTLGKRRVDIYMSNISVSQLNATFNRDDSGLIVGPGWRFAVGPLGP